MIRPILLGAAVVAVAGCVSSGPRPVPPSAEEIIDARLPVARSAALRAVTNLGLPLRTSEASGQVETNYVDIASYRPAANQYPQAERLVRFIVSVRQDPNGSGSEVAIRALYNPFRTGLSDTRRGERGVPRSHPAMEVVEELMREIRTAAEGG